VSESQAYVEIRRGSERNFGLTLAAAFVLVALAPLIKHGHIRLWSVGVAAVFGVLGLFAPKVLEIPNRLWFKLGIFLGGIVAPIVMGLLFLLAVTPTGLIMRLFGKDGLRRKFDKQATSYWIVRDRPLGSMKNQF